MAATAIPITSGPVEVYVKMRVSASSSTAGVFFFGFGTVAPQSQIVYPWEGVMSDRTGRKVPRDKMSQSEEAFIFVQMAEWDDTVRERLSSVPNTGGTAGLHPFGDVGTLVVTEGYAYELYLKYLYGKGGNNHPAMANLIAGYHFYGVTPLQQKNQPGTQPNNTDWQWHAIPVPVASAAGTFICYDHNMSALPTVPQG